MLARLEANRIRQMIERYRITKLLDDLEDVRGARDELLRALADSRALALAERLSRAASGAATRRSPARRSARRSTSAERRWARRRRSRRSGAVIRQLELFRSSSSCL